MKPWRGLIAIALIAGCAHPRHWSPTDMNPHPETACQEFGYCGPFVYEVRINGQKCYGPDWTKHTTYVTPGIGIDTVLHPDEDPDLRCEKRR